MCAALTHNNSLDGCRALPAGLTGTPVYLKEVLEIAAAVHPVNACAMVANTSLEHQTDI